MESVKIAIVGAGPAGLSAACHAAELGVSHVLLETSPQYSNTIFRYQKGKFVMAEPAVLPLRSPLKFQPGSREQVLSWWQEGADRLRVNARFGAEVTAIKGERGRFVLQCAGGSALQAETVVLAIGLQGNLRKLGVPGETLPFVQYQLDDPDEYAGETIVVVGAGDAAIENAIALTAHNQVIIVNRQDEFSRAKDANNQAILAAIANPAVRLDCFYNANVNHVEAAAAAGGKRGKIVLNTADGQADIPCDRVIARLGASPPRKFVESCRVIFPGDDPSSVPEVSAQYESNVPGLYIIGALAGYPLIKQAMNQGYEVIEFILGNAVEPADTPLLRDKFKPVPGGRDVDQTIEFIRERIPLLSPLSALQLREFLLDSVIHGPKPGDIIFRHKDYTNSMYFILNGEVHLNVHPDDPTSLVTLSEGGFFGEMGLISGRRRSATVSAGERCLLIETPRRSMLKLMNSVEAVRRKIDEAFLLRAVQAHIAPGCPSGALEELVRTATLQKFAPNEHLFHEGEPGECLYLIRSGSVTVSRVLAGKEVVLAYVPAGKYVGEMALLSDTPRSASVRAAVAIETIRLEGAAFKKLLDEQPLVRQQVQAVYEERLAHEMTMATHPEAGGIISFLMQQGLGEATDVLLIDESLCIRCDYCERACAATHGNVSRLDREAGPTFAHVHVPTSCRHCEHPHCMKDCPPDAIHRAPNGEVFIDDTCIGCGNCEKNCPYSVIHMGVQSDQRPGVVSWLLTGLGTEPGLEYKPPAGDKRAKTAVKCDMCKDLGGGPACVRACPTGAAQRVSPEKFIGLVSRE